MCTLLALFVIANPAVYTATALRDAGVIEFKVDSSSELFRVIYTEEDTSISKAVVKSVEQAIPKAMRWGPFHAPVTIKVYPTHESLERAIDRIGFPWLRAWAQYDTIHIQSPRTWGIDYSSQLDELLTHELTHVVMYQNVAVRSDWAYKEIPLWFREGMASFTSEQGYRRGTPDDLAVAFRTRDDEDPLDPSFEMLRLNKDLVYNAGHWSFTYLISTRGESAVKGIMAGIKKGLTFEKAFLGATGVETRGFVEKWKLHISEQELARNNGHMNPVGGPVNREGRIGQAGVGGTVITPGADVKAGAAAGAPAGAGVNNSTGGEGGRRDH